MKNNFPGILMEISPHFLPPPAGVGKTLKKINKAIVSKKNKDTVTVANAMFVKNGSKIEMPFVTRNKDVFQCEVRNVNFKDPASACDSINAWVKNETRGEWSRLPGQLFFMALHFVNERVSQTPGFQLEPARPLGLLL